LRPKSYKKYYLDGLLPGFRMIHIKVVDLQAGSKIAYKNRFKPYKFNMNRI